MDQIEIAKGAEVLRDFFSAINAEEIKSSTINLSRHFGLPLSPVKDWTEVEYDFNRLFVGPAAVPAPPYASAYQEEPSLMGAPAIDVRNFYRRLGLAVPDQGATPDDHLSFELDAFLAIAHVAEADGGEISSELKDWFILEHMGGWVPKFTAAIDRQDGVSPPVRMASLALATWLECAGQGARTQD